MIHLSLRYLCMQDNHNFEREAGANTSVDSGEKGNADTIVEKGPAVYLRFGKFTKHRFVLDFQAPMSATVALGICVSCFAKKLTVT